MAATLCAAQAGVDAALHDPEQRLVAASAGGEAALGPAVRPLHGGAAPRLAGRVASTSWSKAMAMSLPSASWISIARSGVSRCGDPSRWLAKVTPSSSTLPEVREAEDLEAAGIGQDRPVPAHEPMQPAEPGDPLVAGPQREVVGVGEDDLRRPPPAGRPATAP